MLLAWRCGRRWRGGLLQFVDESGVGLVAVLAECRVKAHYPELAEICLFVAAVREGVPACAHKRLARGVQFLRADATVTLGSLQNILAALIGVYATFNSCHTKICIKN
jgi:hypothetical protein